MKLYTYYRSQASFRVRIALNLKGIAREDSFLHLLDVIARTGGAIDFPTSSERSDPNAIGPIDLATECAAGRIHTREQPTRSAAQLRVRARRPAWARPLKGYDDDREYSGTESGFREVFSVSRACARGCKKSPSGTLALAAVSVESS